MATIRNISYHTIQTDHVDEAAISRRGREMTTIDLRTGPARRSASDIDAVESFNDSDAVAFKFSTSPSSKFEITTELWVLLCVAGALTLISTSALFLYGQGSVGI